MPLVNHDVDQSQDGDQVPGLEAMSIKSSAYTEVPASSPPAWTDFLPDNEGTRFFKSIDWSQSVLGSPEQWPASLRSAVRLVFDDSRGACIYWGPDRVAIYNQVYTPMAGKAHPELMGKPFYVGYPELWEGIKPIFDSVQTSGIAIDVNNMELFTDRFGYLEETYFIGQFIPLRGDDGRVEGFYNTVYESTYQVIELRRRKLINQIAALPDCTFDQVNSHIEEILKSNSRDIPMAMAFYIDSSDESNRQLLRLQMNIGVLDPGTWIPEDADLTTDSRGIMSLLRKTQLTKDITTLCLKEGSLPPHVSTLMQGVSWSGFEEPSTTLMLAPLISAGNILGFLIIGANPRRIVSDECKQFVHGLTSQIAGRWASAVTVDQAKRREDRLILDLAIREQRIRHMAESAPVGFLHLKTDGCAVWANKHYFTMTNLSTDLERCRELSFIDSFRDDDHASLHSLWSDLIHGQKSVTGEARLRHSFSPPHQINHSGDSSQDFPSWVLVQGFVLKDVQEVELIMICFTDISGIKWAESVQSRIAEAANQSKRQQEKFIDITSHEMRNPLSAIMQSAQSIISVTEDIRGEVGDGAVDAMTAEIIDAASTIMTCGFHQKRIIGDVLMLSRLENDMFSIAPAIIDPITLTQKTIRMLNGDVKSNEIDIALVRHESLSQHHISNVHCDSLRLSQILINLLSNSIKFTKGEKEKSVEVTCAATLQLPLSLEHLRHIRWAVSGVVHQDPTDLPDWGRGEVVYLYFLIRDTGPGMTQEQIKRLFTRFSQATTMTHIKYGGSGLGLYISRELTERQGGQIGVSSQPGKGSVFAFFIKSRRADSGIQSPPVIVGHSGNTPLTPNSPPPNHVRKDLKTTSGGKQCLLLVEDNLVNQKILSRQLIKAGCIVYVANNGQEALDFLKTTDAWGEGVEKNTIHLDVILMDWNMPVMDGLTSTRRIRSLQDEGKLRPSIPVIGITANVRTEQLQEARTAGMDDVISKPFLVEEVLVKIKQFVRP